VYRTIVKPAIQITMEQVKGLTRREQLVLVILTGLFIVGLTVKIWRQAGETSPATAALEH
jgi:hypothetical protein